MDALARLLYQLSSSARAPGPDRLRSVLPREATHVLVARADGAIVGTASLVLRETLGHRFGLIEDVVVDATTRGTGIGTQLVHVLNCDRYALGPTA